MEIFKSIKVFLIILLSVLTLLTIVIGIGFGYLLALTNNRDLRSEMYRSEVALPSRALDRNGELIAEYFGDEKRILVNLDEVPKHLVEAILSREDNSFFEHNGIDFLGSMKAALKYFTGNKGPGASTITQQVVRLLGLEDITDQSLSRKIREMWWAMQLERQLTKQEILEYYMNNSFFGSGAYGIEAGSQYYFKHSISEITLGESALLVTFMSRPGGQYSPYNNPKNARGRQVDTLNRMIANGYITQAEADNAVEDFWDNFDYTAPAKGSLYEENTSLAPHFTEYVRIQLANKLYGSVDINRDGYTIYTTLDLRNQKIAENLMNTYYVKFNDDWRKQRKRRSNAALEFLPLIDLFALSTDIEGLSVKGARNRSLARDYYDTEYNKVLELLTLGIPDFGLNGVTQKKRREQSRYIEQTTIEGALITIDTHTGQIISMVGGSDFETSKLNRTTDSRIMPGSSFKPLYYSAGIKNRIITPGTMIPDSPVVFIEENGVPFTPENYIGTWEGSVLAWYALAHSMNVPSVQVMEMIGFDRAFDTASKLLGLSEFRDNEDYFYHGYSSALGISPVAPINMVQAYATIGNKGSEVIPFGIKTVQDRNGNIKYDFEKEIRELQEAKRRDEVQILTPQEAYVMTTMLQNVTRYGTLKWRMKEVDWPLDEMNVAGKTGTTQNWGDAWTLGFTDYYTTAIWFGFDRPGNSLGRELTGATAAGKVWSRYMKAIHEDKEARLFDRPSSGIITRTVCAESGELYHEGVCTDGKVELTYLAGTEPKNLCSYHYTIKDRDTEVITALEDASEMVDVNTDEADTMINSMKDKYKYLGVDLDDNDDDDDSIILDGNSLLDDEDDFIDDSGIGDVSPGILE